MLQITLTPEEKLASHREACRRYRLKNKDKIRDASKRYLQENRVAIREYRKQWRKNSGYTQRYRLAKKQQAIELLGSKCINCGSTERLEFDHIKMDREDDKHIVTRMIYSNKWSDVLEELKKCQLLCKSCHIKKSNSERGHTGLQRHGILGTYTSGCRCKQCSDCHKSYMREWRRKNKLKQAESVII